jgi:glycosyltransferase involved in cell wall biosynthesis
MGIPFFSVVIPVYNRAQKIQPTLMSVVQQTFKDFECLVVDDGSKDGEALEAVVAGLGDERFRYIRQDNAGASAARNRGFDMARGEYIALLDSDDLFLPQKLETQKSFIESGVSKQVIFNQMIVERGNEKKWIKPAIGPLENERIDEYLMCTPGWIQSSTMVLPTEFARTVRFNERLPSSQDTDFAIRCASAGAKFTFIAQPLTVLDDIFDPNRVSKQAKYLPLLAWIDEMRNVHVSERAYWAYRGWQCARVASYSNRILGLKLFLQSAVRGVYAPKQALVIANQVIFPPAVYQRLVNIIVKNFGKKMPRPTTDAL